MVSRRGRVTRRGGAFNTHRVGREVHSRAECLEIPLLPAVLSCSRVSSAEVPVELVAREGARITVDGVLRDWSVELSTLGAGAEVVAGASSWRGPDDARLRFALARDEQSLWIAAEITDYRLGALPARLPSEDAVVLTFAVVDGGPVRELALHPGDPGRFASEARWTVGGSEARARRRGGRSPCAARDLARGPHPLGVAPGRLRGPRAAAGTRSPPGRRRGRRDQRAGQRREATREPRRPSRSARPP